jgi:hypothetical protein
MAVNETEIEVNYHNLASEKFGNLPRVDLNSGRFDFSSVSQSPKIFLNKTPDSGIPFSEDGCPF